MKTLKIGHYSIIALARVAVSYRSEELLRLNSPGEHLDRMKTPVIVYSFEQFTPQLYIYKYGV